MKLTDKTLSKSLRFSLILASLFIILAAVTAMALSAELPTFVNNAPPAINATNLNAIVDAIKYESNAYIYVEGTQIIARNQNGDIIASGTAGTDDTTTIQGVIDSVEAGGLIVFSPDTFYLTSPLTISKALSIRGTCGLEIPALPTLPDAYIDHAYGTVLVQQTAGANVIDVTASGDSVNIENFLLTWADAIKNSNTGHGIYANPPVRTTWQNNGIMHSIWNNIKVLGADGNHYGFVIVNTMYNNFEQLASYNGGGIHFISNSEEVHYGNTVITNFFNYLNNAGTAHGIYMTTEGSYGLNFLTFVRPQVNVQVGGGQVAQKHLEYAESTGPVYYISLYSIDFEANNEGGARLPLNSLWIASICSGVTGCTYPNFYMPQSEITSYKLSGSYVVANGPLCVNSAVYRGTPEVTEAATDATVTHNLNA
jgi:hypothetical protein